MAMIEIDEDDLRRLYDLATDSPLMCSGSFETDDVRVLRRLGLKIGADLGPATPVEFERDFPHAFDDGVRRMPITVPDLRPRRRGFYRLETPEETAARIARQIPSTTCKAGSYNRPCGRDADHPLHQSGAPEPTSDPDAMIDEED